MLNIRSSGRGVGETACAGPPPARGSSFIRVPIAQYTELECPKLQVAGGSPAGDAIFQAGVVQQQNTALPRLRRRCDSVHPLQFVGGVAHQQSARLTCERQRGQHSPLPPFIEGSAGILCSWAAESTFNLNQEFKLPLQVHVSESLI